MADSITGFTKEYMDALDDDIITGANISDGNLILTKKNAAPIDAGNIVGIRGDSGPAGTVNEVDVTQAIVDRQPTAWVPMTLVSSWSSALPENVMPPSYRIENGYIRFAGVLVWNGSSQTYATNVQVCSALGVDAAVSYEHIIYRARSGGGLEGGQHEAAEMRYYNTTRTVWLMNRSHIMDNGDMYALENAKIPLG